MSPHSKNTERKHNDDMLLEDWLNPVDETRLKSILMDDLTAIRQRCAALPVLDNRTSDEIIGYDERGLPS